MTGPIPCGCGCGALLTVGQNRGEPRRFLTEPHRRRWWAHACHQGAVRLRTKPTRFPRRPKERWINLLAIPLGDRRRLLERLFAPFLTASDAAQSVENERS